MNNKFICGLGWLASIMACAMYFSYIDQIILNMNGHSGSLILPMTTTINCMCWAAYGFLKESRDWPLVTCNLPGIFLGIITAFTAI